MNFMQKCKRNGGFTLVELIVVIAILAILAGVAVPAYTGYIKKAEKAGDLQLVGAVNTAFAAACLESGFDSNDVLSAKIGIEDNKVTGVQHVAVSDVTLSATPTSGRRSLSTTELANVAEAFLRYFTNTDSAFKVVVHLAFDSETHSFEGLSEEEYEVYKKENATTVNYAGVDIYVSDDAIASLKGSTFGETIGAEALLTEVAGLTNFIGTDDFSDEMLEDRGYLSSLASYVGITVTDDMDNDAIMAEIDKKTNHFTGEQAGNMMINGLVFYAAENTAKLSHSEITNFLTSGNITSNLGSTQSEKLAKASMAYGMYTAFVNSDYNKNGAVSSTTDPMGAIKTISGKGDNAAAFQEYMNSAEGQADLDAYMSAMTIINDSTGNDATIDVLGNGFSNGELMDLMKDVIGK